jgi:death-on-curing protein
MTEEKPPDILYLNKREDYASIHAYLSTWVVDHGDEPIPAFGFANQADLDALLLTPQQSFYGIEAYPTLAEKAAIIFYTINKKQIFLNGNKRMSTLSLLIFLSMNGKELSISPDDLTAKALWLAQTSSLAFPDIKRDLVEWIERYLIDEI